MNYFDYAATTPPYEEVIVTIAEVMAQHYGNPSSLHRLGEQSEMLVKRAREACSSILHVKPSELVFTSGATESNNLAIKGLAFQYQQRGRHLITTMVEHPSVYECMKQLESWGWEVTYLTPDQTGRISARQVEDALRDDTVLVSIMHVNHEVGSIQPIEEIGAMLKHKRRKPFFHVDGVQGFGKVPLLLPSSEIDLYSLSAHKWRGPKGIGLLYVRQGVQLAPLLSGGGQEGDVRSGTENVPLIIGMAQAMRLTAQGQAQRVKILEKLKGQLEAALTAMPEVQLNSSADGAPHIVHFSCEGIKAETLLHKLEEQGFYVSSQSACSSKQIEPSRVLLQMGKSKAQAISGIRISLNEAHTTEQVHDLIEAISKSIQFLIPFKQK
ncbi:cysteine desulfurase family protein [Paenibacillus turicensis]|uniref:cysteine desulfurase family protein n=1 Tax=Paenibacillus turicensis TaxID=160487 RepID=UPI003D2C8D37